jgi:hypothetical protein
MIIKCIISIISIKCIISIISISYATVGEIIKNKEMNQKEGLWNQEDLGSSLTLSCICSVAMINSYKCLLNLVFNLQTKDCYYFEELW